MNLKKTHRAKVLKNIAGIVAGITFSLITALNSNAVEKSKNFYELLGVEPAATGLDIKKAYRKFAMQWHPDRNQGSKESEEMFKVISDAYLVLSDLVKRAQYDRQLREQQSSVVSESTTGDPTENHWGDSEFNGGEVNLADLIRDPFYRYATGSEASGGLNMTLDQADFALEQWKKTSKAFEILFFLDRYRDAYGIAVSTLHFTRGKSARAFAEKMAGTKHSIDSLEDYYLESLALLKNVNEPIFTTRLHDLQQIALKMLEVRMQNPTAFAVGRNQGRALLELLKYLNLGHSMVLALKKATNAAVAVVGEVPALWYFVAELAQEDSKHLSKQLSHASLSNRYIDVFYNTNALPTILRHFQTYGFSVLRSPRLIQSAVKIMLRAPSNEEGTTLALKMIEFAVASEKNEGLALTGALAEDWFINAADHKMTEDALSVFEQVYAYARKVMKTSPEKARKFGLWAAAQRPDESGNYPWGLIEQVKSAAVLYLKESPHADLTPIPLSERIESCVANLIQRVKR